MTEPRKEFTAEEAHRYGEAIGIDWISAPFDVAQFQAGMNVELEHGLHDPVTNVTDDDPHVTAKIALAQLNEFHDYCTRLERMEKKRSETLRVRRRSLRFNFGAPFTPRRNSTIIGGRRLRTGSVRAAHWPHVRQE